MRLRHSDNVGFTHVFQSTHPHGVRHLSVHCMQMDVRVSIHAPARGATQDDKRIAVIDDVSIHAPARGATSSTSRTNLPTMFQSTHPHGVRRGRKWICSGLMEFQSTHPHGVRQKIIEPIKHRYSFNPRTRTGCDVTLPIVGQDREVSIHAPARGATFRTALRMMSVKFQSTHPHGVRPVPSALSVGTESFNPRTRTGCDVYPTM